MEENPEGHAADPNLDTAKLKQVDRRNIKPRLTKLRIYEVFTALCFVIAGFVLGLNFLGFDPRQLALYATGFFFAGLILSAFALRLWLLNNHRTKRRANLWFSLVVVPSALLCGYIAVEVARQELIKTVASPVNVSAPTTTPGPELYLLLHAPELPDFVLPLTGKGLLVDVDERVIEFSNHLYFPVASTNSPLTLRMSVGNRPEDGKTAAEGFTVGVSYSESVECSFGGGWEVGGVGLLGFKHIYYRGDNVTLYAKSGKLLTDIAFKPTNGWNDWVPTGTGMGQNPTKFGILLSVYGKGTERKTIPFTVFVPVLPSTSPVEPKILLKGAATNLSFVWSTNKP